MCDRAASNAPHLIGACYLASNLSTRRVDNAPAAALGARVMTVPYLLQLQNASYASLSAAAFKTAVVDMDDTGMNRTQVQALEGQGKLQVALSRVREAG